MSKREDAIVALFQSWIDAKTSLICERSGATSKDLAVFRQDAVARARVLRLSQSRLDFSELDEIVKEGIC